MTMRFSSVKAGGRWSIGFQKRGFGSEGAAEWAQAPAFLAFSCPKFSCFMYFFTCTKDLEIMEKIENHCWWPIILVVQRGPGLSVSVGRWQLQVEPHIPDPNSYTAAVAQGDGGDGGDGESRVAMRRR